MDLSTFIHADMTRQESFVVEEKHLALHVGSGSAGVLATPALVALMEITSHRLLAEHLPAGYSSVGTMVNMRHLAATPLGARVHIYARVENVDGWRVNLAIEAWDEVAGERDKIGECQHERFVIDEARFIKRVEAKRAKLEVSER